MSTSVSWSSFPPQVSEKSGVRIPEPIFLLHTTTSTASSSLSDSSPPPYETHRMPIFPARIPAQFFTLNTLHTTDSYHREPDPLPSTKARTFGIDVSRAPTPANVSIPHLREAIDSLDSKMASLMSQREKLESHLAQAVRLQSPISRLPSELLASIFIRGVLGMDEDESVMVSTLMLVSKYWADLAVNTPILWSRITVSTYSSLDKTRRKLARSKSAPLDITANFSPRVEHSSGIMENVVHALDLIRPALWRTRSFRLSVLSRSQAHAALSRCREDAPMLEVLSIRILHSMQEETHSNPPLPLFNGCIPRLQSCSFTSFDFGWDLRTVSGLRVLKLCGYWNGSSPSVETILNILRGCPELEEFALRNVSDVDSDLCFNPDHEWIRKKVVQLPRLTKASFHDTGVMRLRMLLSQVAFPSLQSLELCYMDNLTPLFQHLKQQSLVSLPLRYLRIESCFFNELKFVSILQRLPSLVTLELVDVEDVSSNLLKGLSTPPGSHPWICPKLETLNLDGCTNLDWDSLRTLIESRLSTRSQAYSRSSVPSYSISSASVAASIHARSLASLPHSTQFGYPQRLRFIDVTRCHQISKEGVQWLRMYVSQVKSEPAKGVWGEPAMP